jgi:leader peptidase (prepilin peptidase)/N-methyltransferase
MTHWLFILAISSQTQDRLLTNVLWWIAILWFGCLGGCVGSFLTVVWDRLGTGEGFVLPRSRCPECDHPIRWYHNIPVVGWLLLWGRCYDCGSRIPHRISDTSLVQRRTALGSAARPNCFQHPRIDLTRR